MKFDLMPWDNHPNQLRCRPNKECEQRRDLVLCHRHLRKRNPSNMREIRPGVWECRPPHICHLRSTQPRAERQSSTPFGVQQAASSRAARPPRGGGGDHPRGEHQNTWAPGSSAVQVGNSGGNEQRAAQREVRRIVWCAYHGKQLPISDTLPLGDCCFTCGGDQSRCLSTTLDAPSRLVEAGCTDILCARHHTLRSAAFMKVNEAGTGYECMEMHECRNPTFTFFDDATNKDPERGGADDDEEFGGSQFPLTDNNNNNINSNYNNNANYGVGDGVASFFA